MRDILAILRSLTLPFGAGTGPRIVIGATPTPTELAAYYTAGVAGITPTAPESVVGLTQNFDGQGNYSYTALVIDSSAMKVTSLVTGATVAGVVTEAGRFELNPGALLGGARYQTFQERQILILTDPADGTTLLATRHPGDAFDVWSVNTVGTQGWGTGAALTDLYQSRVDVGMMEIGSRLQIRGFGLLSDNAYNTLVNGEGNGRWFVHMDGTERWSNGTNPSDAGISRGGVNVLNVDGDLALATLGDGLLIKEGANGAQGTVTLVAGAATVNVNWIAANSRIFLTCQVPGGAPGALRVDSRVVNTSFTIKSTSATDTSTVAYLIMSPA